MSSHSSLKKEASFETHTEEQDLEKVPNYTEEEYKKILRKIDKQLLPFVSLLYLLSFLDRANIGNAKIAGLAKDLHLEGLQYNVIAGVFFIPYAAAEVPSNICLKLFRPSIWIPSIMVAWGIVMTLMCLCNSYHGLIVARIFLGLTEAGLFPGITYYLSLWYRKRDVAVRIAIFFSAATLAGAFGGILAFAIEKMEGIGGLHGWQWIFCLEGIATVLVAFVSYFFMHDYPATAKFLTEHERAIVLHTLKEDTQGQSRHFDKKFVIQAISDYKTYVQMGIYCGLLLTVYAIALFIPTIINELGYSSAKAQLLTVPVFVAGCLTTVLFGYLSDRYHIRGPFVIGSCLLAMIGYIILYTQDTPGAAYAGAVLAAMGAYPTIAIDLAWAGSAVGGDIQKGVVLAMVVGTGNLGGICSSFVYITPPRFHVGHGTIMGWLGLSIVLSLFAMWDYNRLNKKNIAICEREGIDESRRHEFREMGNKSPLFRYAI
jgi:MFS family permease